MIIATSDSNDVAFRINAEKLLTADAVLREHTIVVDDDGNPAKTSALSLRFRSRIPEGCPLEDHVTDLLSQLRGGESKTIERFFQSYHPTLSVRVVAYQTAIPSIAFPRNILRELADFNCDLDIDVAVAIPQ